MLLVQVLLLLLLLLHRQLLLCKMAAWPVYCTVELLVRRRIETGRHGAIKTVRRKLRTVVLLE
jgi:hypothetical protein